MKYCPNCGKAANDEERFCGSCGTAFPEAANTSAQYPNSYDNQANQYGAQQNTYQQPYPQQTSGLFGDYVPPVANTRDEFINLPENDNLRKGCRTAAIICYVCAGISLIVMCFAFGNWTSLLDVCLLTGLGLGIHLKQNFVCAIVLLVYSIINVILMISLTGSFGGWLVLIAGIVAVLNTSKVNKAWKEYQMNRQQTYQQPPYQPPYQQ